MTTNLFKNIAMLAIGIMSFTACEKAEMIVPQQNASATETLGKKKSIGDGDAIAVDPEVASQPENPVITRNKTLPIHAGNEAIQELQHASDPETSGTNNGTNPEVGKRRNRPSDEVREGRYIPVTATPATYNPTGPGRSNTEPK